jgi:hypothetical protein
MEQRIFIEGPTEKMLQLLMPQIETLVLLNKKCIFKHYGKFQARKTLLIDIIFPVKKIMFGISELPLYAYVSTSQRCTFPLNLKEFFFKTKSGKARFKNVNNCLTTNIYSYLKTSGGLSSNLYLNVVHFFNTSVV